MFPLSALTMVLTMPLVGRMFDRLGGPTLTLRQIALYPIGCAVLAALLLRTPAGVTMGSGLEIRHRDRSKP